MKFRDTVTVDMKRRIVLPKGYSDSSFLYTVEMRVLPVPIEPNHITAEHAYLSLRPHIEEGLPEPDDAFGTYLAYTRRDHSTESGRRIVLDPDELDYALIQIGRAEDGKGALLLVHDEHKIDIWSPNHFPAFMAAIKNYMMPRIEKKVRKSLKGAIGHRVEEIVRNYFPEE